MMDPLSDGQMPIGLYVTQWLLVGVLVLLAAIRRALDGVQGREGPQELWSSVRSSSA